MAEFDIYKENGEYDKNKIKKIDSQTIDFIYKNVAERMKRLDEDIKIVGTHSRWLLGILTFTLVYLAPLAFKDFTLFPKAEEFILNEIMIRDLAKFLCVVCFAIIIAHTIRLIEPSFGWGFDDESEKIIKTSASQDDIKLIKILEIQELQQRINYKKKRLKTLTSGFDAFVFYAIVFSLYILAWIFFG